MSTALVSMGISIPVIMFLKRDSRNAWWVKRCLVFIEIFKVLIHFHFSFAAYCVSNVARLLGITYEVHGIENVQLDSGGIIMLNHQGCLDLVAIIEIYWVCRNVSPMMKKEIFYALPFGIAAYLCNGVFIDRKNRAAATKVLSNEASKIKQGVSAYSYTMFTHFTLNFLIFRLSWWSARRVLATAEKLCYHSRKVLSIWL